MIGYVTIGTDDFDKALPFYEGVFGAIGGERKSFDGGWGFYGDKEGDGDVGICKPHDGQAARAGNGIMIAFKANATGDVKAAYEAGLKNGGKDEGAPGPRPADSKTFFGAYLRDPTGNKLCVFWRPAAA